MGLSAGVFLRGGSDSPGALAGQHQQEASAAAHATSASAWRFLKEMLVTPLSAPQKCQGCGVLPPRPSPRTLGTGLRRSPACTSHMWS